MQKWEYCEVKDFDAGRFSIHTSTVQVYSASGDRQVQEITDGKQTVAKLGLEGWELIEVILPSVTEQKETRYILKRPIK